MTNGITGCYGYSYGVITQAAIAHAREASRHSALSHPSRPPSVRSRRRTSTDDQHSQVEPSSYSHTRESSAVGRSSVEDEATHGYRRRYNEVRHSEEGRRRSYDHQRYYHHPHQPHLCVPNTHHIYQRYDPQTRQFHYSSSLPKDTKFLVPAQSKVVAVRSKNNDISWQRKISKSIGLAKARDYGRLEEKLPISTEPKAKKKKWKWWWGKKKEKVPVEPEHHDVYNAPKHKEPEMAIQPEPRHSMLEWLGGESLPVQSPQALKDIFEREY